MRIALRRRCGVWEGRESAVHHDGLVDNSPDSFNRPRTAIQYKRPSALAASWRVNVPPAVRYARSATPNGTSSDAEDGRGRASARLSALSPSLVVLRDDVFVIRFPKSCLRSRRFGRAPKSVTGIADCASTLICYVRRGLPLFFGGVCV